VKIRRIDFSPDEWLAGTVGMTAVELGVYWQACALIYSRDAPITDDLLIRAIAGDPRPIKNAIARLVAWDKLQRSGSELTQKRCTSELEVSRNRIASASENGRKGGRPSSKIKDIEKPGGFCGQKLTINHQPSTIKEEDSEATPLPPIDPTKEVFDRGVAMLGKARRALLGKFCKQHGDVAVLEALVATEAANPVDPVSYFIACMSRAPPARNGHDKDSPVTTLYKGAYRAAEAIIERERREADRLADLPPAIPLLDRG
jgi:Protein of unknown function (DUF1376).